jgi:hypothetical protein
LTKQHFGVEYDLLEIVMSSGGLNIKDMTGMVFGLLTVVDRAPSRRNSAYWNCQCSCGGVTSVRGADLRNGKTKSCGCIHTEQLAKRSTKHGMSRSPEYMVWHSLVARCSRSNCAAYPLYGGRGIKLGESFSTFQKFYDVIGDRPSKHHSVERIDNNGDYEAGNCVWATDVEQSRNKRTNVNITHDGRTQCLADWAKESKFSESNFYYRYYKKKWSISQLMS